METKICRICGIEKPIDEYNKCSGKQCRRSECKQCQKEIYKQYRLENKEKIDKKHKNYVLNHKEQYSLYSHNYYLKNKDKYKDKRINYYKINEEKIKQYNQKYYLTNKEKIVDKIIKYRDNNKKHLIEKQIEYNKKRRNEDELFKLKTNVRNMINRSFTRKEYQKSKHTEEILGCNINYFIKHLLKTYKNNYGHEWNGIEDIHIDHIIPLKSATTKEEVMQLCNYKNLQLLKAKDNLRKSYKIDYVLKGGI